MRIILLLAALILAAPLVARAGEEITPQTFDSDGVKISYAVVGKGEPVVLLHGLYSSYFMNWQMPGIIAMLAKDHQVIALDLRGHGNSDKPTTEAAYGMEMVNDVIRLMDKLNIKAAHIVGYSMGGVIAAKLIATHSDRALSGVLGGMGWLKQGGVMEKLWEGFMGKREFMSTPPECSRAIGKLAMTEDELKSIKVPMIMLVGERDPIKKESVEPASQVRPDWDVVEIKGAGHLTCVVQPQFKDELKKWLETHTTKTPDETRNVR